MEKETITQNANSGNAYVIAGGGTGGHIFPAIAIANALKQLDPNARFLFVGARGKMEMERVPQAGYEIVGLDIAGFNRSSLLKNIALPYKLVKSFFQVSGIFSSFKPTAVIGVGGYSSFPVLRYAQRKGIPTFVHESNAFAGRSNIMLGKNATAVFTATSDMAKFFPAYKIIVTGNPVRENIVAQHISRDEAIRFFGLDPQKKTVLSIGGSLGAQSINEALSADLEIFADEKLQLIWQTGTPYFEKAKERAEGMKHVCVTDFISRMDMAYAAADLVVSRSGAMAISELAVVKKPVIFVPYPFAAEDHQRANALTLVNQGAAQMISNAEAAQRLVPAVVALAADAHTQESMQENIGKLGVKDAAVKIAENIFNRVNA